MDNRLPISIVILTCNEAARIQKCVLNALLISDDVVVVDSGSTDKTVEIAQVLGCSVLQECWNGYGSNKNKGIRAAKYNWILSLDADEVPDDDLINALKKLDLSNPEMVYNIPFKIFFKEKVIRFGSFGSEKHLRLFNRGLVKWADVPVHETLLLNKNSKIKLMPGYINHYAIRTPKEYKRKMLHYAALSAHKYMMSGRKSTVVKRYFSPLFNFLKNYIFRLGLLDGKEGLFIASTMAWYTWTKYQYLHEQKMQRDLAAHLSVNESASA